ncbi:HDOD domain-containing protein [Pseudoxanthomonas sp. NC8]|nr:HDOD domain-containing protein [Pseudoxanthomonas sp. NC8]
MLRLANSSFHRVRAEPVESLERAVALVGTSGLRQLVSLALLQPVMQAEGGSLGGLPGRIWEHTQLAAAIASRLATQDGEDGFAAQLLALLRGLRIDRGGAGRARRLCRSRAGRAFAGGHRQRAPAGLVAHRRDHRPALGTVTAVMRGA